jgi:hypothetical protein
LRIKVHHILIITAAAFVVPHFILAISIYLWYFPFFVWFGVAAVLLFSAAILMVMVKSLLKPKLRMKVHRVLTLLAGAFMLIHIYFALRVYF